MSTYDKWKSILIKIVSPIIEGFADKSIINNFPKIYSPWLANVVPSSTPGPNQKKDKYNDDKIFMELFCRTVLGINILFNKKNIENDEIIKNLFNKTLIGFTNVFNGMIDFNNMDNQIIVEMALLAISFKRHSYLWNNINNSTKDKILNTMIMAKNKFIPNFNNWLLFKCMIDIFLFLNNKTKDLSSCYINLNKFEKFYIGDGWYKDGVTFHIDYYNSFVIHPLLLDIYDELKKINISYEEKYNNQIIRIQRYTEFLERMIASDGTFPLFGRSMVYRTAVFHALSYCAYLNILPTTLSNGQVRCGLDAVINKIFIDDNFDNNNFLHFGFIGYQPEIADSYSNTGSLYYCLLIFIPLGLESNHSFWTDNNDDWTQKKAWSGIKILKDNSISN